MNIQLTQFILQLYTPITSQKIEINNFGISFTLTVGIIAETKKNDIYRAYE
jgi:hypothetical protein